MLDTINLNSTGSLVKVAQYLTGYAEIKKAGDTYDSDFKEHVKEWQAENGLTDDGVVGPASWSKMAANAPTCSTAKNKKSAYTCAAQILVGGLTADGVYGSNTKNSVAAYQSAAGLTADGICGPKTWASLITGSVAASSESSTGTTSGTTSGTSTVVGQKPVDYKQYDSRWGKIKYSTHTSSQTISNSGCGPTSMADIVATWWDKSVTPKEMCALSVANGYRTYNSGTAWGFFEFCAKKYKAFKYIETTSLVTLKEALQRGAYAIVSFRKSKWTTGGHFCCIWKWDGKYFHINDPASASSSRAKGTEAEVKDARKKFFIFYKDDPDKKVKEAVDNPDFTPVQTIQTETNGTANKPTGTEIIDVSRFQGTIDWDKLAPKLAFVIIKASGLYKNGADTQYANNVKGATDHGIPFHAYHFLYCTTDGEARRDAGLFYNTVKANGHMPLYWVLDCEKEWGVANGKARHIAEVFEAELRRLAGDDIRVAVYIGHNVYNEYALDYDHYAYVWIPRYGSNDGTIDGSTKPSYKCDLWQYTSLGKIAGISGNVDMNVITGDGHDLAWFLDGKSEASASTSSAASTSPRKVVISGGNCNVRSLPNTSGSILGVAYDGDELEYGGAIADNGWLSVVYNGTKSWVSGKYGRLV